MVTRNDDRRWRCWCQKREGNIAVVKRSEKMAMVKKREFAKSHLGKLEDKPQSENGEDVQNVFVLHS